MPKAPIMKLLFYQLLLIKEKKSVSHYVCLKEDHASEGQQNAFIELVTNKGGSYEVGSLSSSFNTGKSISHPFCVFERGSTSETCKSQQDVSAKVFSNKGTSYEILTLSAIFDKGKEDQHPVHLRDNKMHLLKLLPIKAQLLSQY
ncbi:PREDICTED: uncharacterized protein LOC109213898 isoform X3 [Nicotiana attenuata]|uniref:uncharacterized protein LOC109213898 isoform X3 n=1 Tax=Nicotiana attenuata TaxID=49451 RepID=UPI000904B2A5|nr:PREDICTED: uncharacterized protein LOC109213898 isoform X3 [Nicotiana attenuata]